MTAGGARPSVSVRDEAEGCFTAVVAAVDALFAAASSAGLNPVRPLTGLGRVLAKWTQFKPAVQTDPGSSAAAMTLPSTVRWRFSAPFSCSPWPSTACGGDGGVPGNAVVKIGATRSRPRSSITGSRWPPSPRRRRLVRPARQRCPDPPNYTKCIARRRRRRRSPPRASRSRPTRRTRRSASRSTTRSVIRPCSS